MARNAEQLKCEVCRSTCFEKSENGFLVCVFCGIQSQDFTNEETQIDDAVGRKVRREARDVNKSARRKVQLSQPLERDPRIFMATLAKVVEYQTNTLVREFGAPSNIVPFIRSVWAAYTLSLEQYCTPSGPPSDDADDTDDETGGSSSTRKLPWRIPTYGLPTMKHTIAACQIAVSCFGLPMDWPDLVHLVEQGRIPYYTVALQIPELQNFSADLQVHLRPLDLRIDYLSTYCTTIAEAASVAGFPRPSLPRYILRYSQELGIPEEVRECASFLTRIFPTITLKPSFHTCSQSKELRPGEVAVAYIAIAFKLLYGLRTNNDVTSFLTPGRPLGVPIDEAAQVKLGQRMPTVELLRKYEALFAISENTPSRAESVVGRRELSSIGRALQQRIDSCPAASPQPAIRSAVELPLQPPPESHGVDWLPTRMAPAYILYERPERKKSTPNSTPPSSFHEDYHGLLRRLAVNTFSTVERIHQAVLDNERVLLGRYSPLTYVHQQYICEICHNVFATVTCLKFHKARHLKKNLRPKEP